jgi:hypothetical protein
MLTPHRYDLELLIRGLRALTGQEPAAYVIDLLTPLGYMLGYGLHARFGRPDVGRAIGLAHRVTPARATAIGVTLAVELAEVAKAVAPNFAGVAAELLQEPWHPHLFRILVVGAGGADVHVGPNYDGRTVGQA